MNRSATRHTTTLLTTLAVSLFTLATAATLRAQEPARDADDAPVRKELEDFREKSSKNAPAGPHPDL